MSDVNQSSMPSVARLSQAISIILLLINYYFFCYRAFGDCHLTNHLTGEILWHIARTGLLSNPAFSKFFALFFLGLAIVSAQRRKDQQSNRVINVCLIAIGIPLYFASSLLLHISGSIASLAIAYMTFTTIGFTFIFSGASRLLRILRLPWDDTDPFGRHKMGFPQEERRRINDFSLHLSARYTWKGERRFSWINLINPRRGILILGSPGAGKSWFIIEPLIRQMIEKGMAMFIYDFKYDALTRLAYYYFTKNKDRYPTKTAFFSINFSDLSRSHRCNVLAPETLTWLSDAIGASRTILLSINKSWSHRQGEFFVESPINFVAALIWYLKKRNGGIFCTLPHVIELAQIPYASLFPLLESEPEIQSLISPFLEAYQNQAKEMLEGQIASAKIPLGRLSSPDIYYILTGNDLRLDINDPVAPRILCLGGDASRQEALSPVLSLYIDRLNKLVNRPGKHPCALVCDEFATVRAYTMTTTIATARSNNIIPVIAVQDLSQLRTQYSREEADLILNITGNLFCGQVSGDTARWISERFPKILQERTSISSNSSDTSFNKSQQWEPAMTQATIATLSSGEFIGIIADDPDQTVERKAFHARIIRDPAEIASTPELPVVNIVDEATLQQLFRQVRKDICNVLLDKCPDQTGKAVALNNNTI